MKKLFAFVLLAIMAASCSDFTEESLVQTEEPSTETRAVVSGSSDYYWYRGEKIPLTVSRS